MTYGSLKIAHEFQDLGGNFFQPIVLEDIKPGTRAFHEELFGPVFSLYRVKSDTKAVELANSNDLGLGTAIFSKDIERAEKLARKIDAGMVYINDFVQS